MDERIARMVVARFASEAELATPADFAKEAERVLNDALPGTHIKVEPHCRRSLR